MIGAAACPLFRGRQAHPFTRIVPQKCPSVTTPHVVEPHCPGAVDRYIDLSGFYDRPGLQPLREQLQTAFAEYQGHYKRVYRCLGAAGELRRDMNELLTAPRCSRSWPSGPPGSSAGS